MVPGRWLVVGAAAVVALGACGGSDFTGPEVVDPDPIVTEYEAAYDAADFERVQAVFSDDGVFFTAGDIQGLHLGDDEMLGALGPDGWEFSRRYQVHAGDDLSLFAPIQVGDHAVAFGWAWQQFAAGVGTMALRDGKVADVVLTVEPLFGGATADTIDPILGEFEAASESGDVEALRSLFGDDAAMVTSAEAHAMYHGDESLVGTLGVDGVALERWLDDHRGQDLVVVEPVQVGDDIAFGWGWEDGDSGTAAMHVEDGRIAVLVLTDADTPVPAA